MSTPGIGADGNPHMHPAIVEDARKDIPEMTDREILVEILENMRAVSDGLSALEQSPIFGAMMGGGNPLAALIGK